MILICRSTILAAAILKFHLIILSMDIADNLMNRFQFISIIIIVLPILLTTQQIKSTQTQEKSFQFCCLANYRAFSQ